MTLIPISIEGFKETKRPYGDNFEILRKFMSGDDDCVKLANYSHVNAKSCRDSIAGSIKRYRYTGRIKVCMRGDEVFLIKTKALD